jgi:predicted nuclease of restriction endonuclease-like (RecB) superfamily
MPGRKPGTTRRSSRNTMAKKRATRPKAKRQIVRAGDLLPEGYEEFLGELKERIRTARLRASLAANRELIELYWHIGRSVVEKQKTRGWGNAVIAHLGEDLQKAFPGESGFSRTNVYRMRALFLAYRGAEKIVPQLVGQISETGLPLAVAELPWGQNVVLIEQIKDLRERLWYARATFAHGWSRAVLVHWIESDLYKRQGKAQTNFEKTLPALQSDLARETLKDPYKFSFLTIAEDAEERELERGLVAHIRQFLIELGTGFAFLGQQYRIEVGGEDYYLDLLFFHVKLRCYIVIDLKGTPFKPEYAGKMNFYLSAVDDLLRHPDDQPSIGIILCKTKNEVVAEYALRDLAKPVGISSYVTKLIESLPPALRGNLPSPKTLEAELKRDDTPEEE